MSSRLTVSHITRFVRRQKLVLAGLILVMSAGAVSLYTKPANEGNPQRSENARLQANGKVRRHRHWPNSSPMRRQKPCRC